MSFTAFDKPRVGEVARCKRCSTTFITKQCECGKDDCGVALWPAGSLQSGVTADIAARLTADRACEFCPKCWSEDERAAIALKQTAQQRGTAGN